MLKALRKRLSLDADDARAILERTLRHHPEHNFAVRLWDGQEVAWSGHRDFTVVIEDAETFRLCFGSRDPARFAEAYADGRLVVEGDLWAATGLASYIRKVEIGAVDALRFIPKLVVPASSHTAERDRRDVQAHYDLPDELFRLFLDDKLVYSCAYFAHPGQTLEKAQERKLDLICKKLALCEGESLLDVGCGWGSLLIWAAKHYGVRAYGITLSENQAAHVRRRAAAEGLADRVTVALSHYGDLPSDRFDKVSSVGMYEHVGLAKLSVYLETVYRALRPGGLFLNHGITAPSCGPATIGGEFIFRHVFPGAEIAPLGRIQDEMEKRGFEILDVQGLRQHYALTLREWFNRFSARRAQAARLVSERTLKVWEMYLAGCARAFGDGVLSIHQVLAGKPDADGRTRGHLTREQMLLGTELC